MKISINNDEVKLTISGVGLQGAAFSHADFTTAQLAALAFTHADFTGAELAALAFTHADFTAQQLTDLAFVHDDFTAQQLADLAFKHDDFTAAELAALAFTHADFTAAQLTDLAFTHADFTAAQLSALAFTHADFTAAELAALAFTHDDFTAAELAALAFTHADFTAAQLAALKGDKGDTGDLSAGGAIGGNINVTGSVSTTGNLNIDGDIVGHNLNSELSGFFIDSAREDFSDTLNSNYTNALAHFEKKGGTLTVTQNGTVVTGGSLYRMFESGSSTAQLNSSTTDTWVFELTDVDLVNSLKWSGSFGIGFSAESWRCRGIKIEASTVATGDYLLQGEITNHPKNWFAVGRVNDDGTIMNQSSPIKRIKITLTDMNHSTYWRINSIWAESHDTTNNDYWLSAGGGQVYGNITANQFHGDGSQLTGISTDNNYVDSAAFNTSDGKLTLGRSGSLGDLTVDLDGKYAESGHDHNTQDIVHAVVLDIGNNNGAVEWYELGMLPDNNGSLLINGILGSHTEGRGRAHLNIRISNRDGLDVAGAVYGNIGDVSISQTEKNDIVVFDDVAANKYRVFLQVTRYSLTNFELRGSRNTMVTYDGVKITTDPANTYGAALFKLSEDDGQFIRVNTDGDLLVNGKVGIGTSSPSDLLEVASSSSWANVRVSGGEGTGTLKLRNYGNSTSGSIIEDTGGGPLRFKSSGAERMRITSSGNVGIGTSSPGSFLDIVANSTNRIIETTSYNTANQYHHVFQNSSGTLVGTITVSTTSTSYNTSSDYRLKENVVPMTGSIDRLKALNPSRFNFIADADTTVDGFLAHEAGEVVPECATGTKDAMMTEEYEVTPAVMDGETIVTEAVMGEREVPDMQGIDQSKLVPLLVAALQEAIARIEVLEQQLGE